jgi:hypothetical protein
MLLPPDGQEPIDHFPEVFAPTRTGFASQSAASWVDLMQSGRKRFVRAPGGHDTLEQTPADRAQAVVSPTK